MVKNKKHAFTIAEIIISFMIIMLVAIAMIPALTKTKPRIETITIRGQYGCWWEGNTLYEQYFDERSPREEKKAVAECKLMLDKRPAHFYMIGVGGGSQYSPAKVSMRYTPAVNSELSIKVGKASDDPDESQTVITSGTSPELVASGGFAYDSTSSLMGENIKPNCTIDASSCGATSCEIKEIIKRDEYGEITQRKYSAVLEGGSCMGFDIYGNQDESNVVDLSKCSLLNNLGVSANFDNMQEADIQKISNANNIYWKCFDEAGREQSLNFQFIDSNYMKPLYMLDFSQNTAYNSKIDETPRFSRIVGEITQRRRSQLIQFYEESKFGAINENGAVLVLW